MNKSSVIAVKSFDTAADQGADTRATAAAPARARVAAVDIYRGLVMLLLLPDIEGGWSFYKLAQEHPDNRLWGALASAFTHSQWAGMTVWDMVMPSFLFLVAVAMPFSVASRRGRGDSQASIYLHLLLRSAALILLAMILRIRLRTLGDELWPFIVLSAGLPIRAAVRGVPWLSKRVDGGGLELLWWALILSAATAHVLKSLAAIGNYDLCHVFTQLALASVCAFALIGKGVRVQLSAAVLILVAYTTVFALYPLPGPEFNPAQHGVHPEDQVFAGRFAHWNKGSNVAAAFDAWFLNLLPRAETYRFSLAGVQTLAFISTIATFIFGIMAGELLRSGRTPAQIRNTLLKWGAGGMAVGLLAGVVLCPIVKSLWTPSWTLLSAGCCAVILAGFYELCEIRGRSSLLFPLLVLGTNSILLYTLASEYRWWFLARVQQLGIDLRSAPLAECAVFILLLWMLAYVLHRWRIIIRL